MILFESSGNLIVALGKTIFHSVWVGLLILAMFRMLLASIPERQSHRRYKLSVTFLLLLFGSVLTLFLLLYKPNLVKVYPLIPGLGNSPKIAWEPKLLFSLCSYLYLAGILFMLLRSLVSVIYLRKLRLSGQKVQNDWLNRLKGIADSLGIKRKVAFLESDRVSGPLLIGFLKPAVIVPVGMFTHLSISQVETIIIHELYHLKRLDYLLNLMQLFMEAMLFYHPAVWYISDRIRKEREYCCDDAVVQLSNDPLNYAKALVCLAEKGIYFRLAPGAGGSSRKHFVTRIGRIIKTNNMKKNRQEKVTPFLLLAAAVLVIMLASSFGSGFSIAKQIDDRQMLEVQHLTPSSTDMHVATQDTIKTLKAQKEKLGEEEMEAARAEALEEIDWDEIKEDMEAARAEAMEDIDWEEIKEDMEAARLEAMEDIDWDQIKEDMEAARMEALEEIDWDQIKEDIEAAKIDAMADHDFDVDFDFDIDVFTENFEQARQEMEEIDWEEMKEEMERNFSEIQIDIEEMRLEIEESLKDIDWDEMRIEIENSRRDLDSPSIEKEN
jgi:beta-lactamase regulating signal transducer with metallopeptidase domain